MTGSRRLARCAALLALAVARRRRAAEDTPFTELPYTPSLDVAVDGPHRRPVRGPLPVLVRRLDEEQPDPRRPGELERLRQAVPGQPALPLGHPAGGGEADGRRARRRSRRSATTSPPAWTRTPSRRPGATPLARRSRRDRRDEVEGELGRDPRLDPRARRRRRRCFFGIGVEQDAKDSTQQIVAIYAGGLGLPDRDYYLKDDDKSKETRAKYVEHVAKMLELLGDTPGRGEGAAPTP